MKEYKIWAFARSAAPNLPASTAENKSFGDASIDSNTEQNFAVIHRQSRKKNCIRLF